MEYKRVIVEFGTGSSLRRLDYTAACIRAIKDALWHNSISFAEAFGCSKEEMKILVELACQSPHVVDCERVAAVFPYGEVQVDVSKGGLDVEKPDAKGQTIIAHAAISVSLPIGDTR